MPIPFLLLDRTAVDLKADVIFLDNDIADAGPVARFRGWSPERHQPLQFRAAGGYGSASEFQSSLPHGKTHADVDQFFVKGMDNFFACCLTNLRGRSILGERQRAEDQHCRQPAATNGVNVEGRHATPLDSLIIDPRKSSSQLSVPSSQCLVPALLTENWELARDPTVTRGRVL